MTRREPRQVRRSGMAIVESTLVLGIALMFMIAIFEYCRFIYVDQLMTNAAREGARYAVVNTGDANLVTNTTAQVNQRMGGVNSNMNNWTVQVYLSDANGNNIGSAANAAFGQYIAVQVDCDFTTVMPNFFFMGKPHLRSRSLMYSESN